VNSAPAEEAAVSDEFDAVDDMPDRIRRMLQDQGGPRALVGYEQADGDIAFLDGALVVSPGWVPPGATIVPFRGLSPLQEFRQEERRTRRRLRAKRKRGRRGK
jgi:hypothetical protein